MRVFTREPDPALTSDPVYPAILFPELSAFCTCLDPVYPAISFTELVGL